MSRLINIMTTKHLRFFLGFMLAIFFLCVLPVALEQTVQVNQISNSNIDAPVYPAMRACTQNPYLGAVGPLANITAEMDRWLGNIPAIGSQATSRRYRNHDHSRFFPFDPMATCLSQSCVGGSCGSDVSKIVCGMDQLQKQKENNAGGSSSPCIVYSIGGNSQWEFELDVLKNSPCEIHTFDCTGHISRFKVPTADPRLHFHHVCLSGYPALDSEPRPAGMEGEIWTLLEMQQRLGHSRIDLLKLDIEGWEFPLFESWPDLYRKEESENILLPMQILVEVHYHTQFETLHRDDLEFKTPTDMVHLQAHLLRMGYVVTIRDDNSNCLHCTELTFIRARCPGTGVYANL